MAASPVERPLTTALRWLLAAIFLAAGVLKAWDPAATAQAIAHYHLLPAGLTPYAGLYVPWLEIVVGLALLGRRWRAGAWLLALLLSGSFLVFTGSALARGLDINCGCFGNGTGHLPWTAALDVVMVGVSAWGLRKVKTSPPSRQSPLQ